MCEQNNNNDNAVDQELLDLSHNLQAVYKNLDVSTNKACMVQMQQKRFDLDILDAEAIRVCKFSSELMAYSYKVNDRFLPKEDIHAMIWEKLSE